MRSQADIWRIVGNWEVDFWLARHPGAIQLRVLGQRCGSRWNQHPELEIVREALDENHTAIAARA